MTTVYEAESSLPPHIQALLVTIRRHHHEWINNIDGGSMSSQHDQMTIYGPFGGGVARVRDQLAQAQAATRSQFTAGTGTVEFVQAIESHDIVIIVLWETSQVLFLGRDEAHAWNLRVTEVYQRFGDEWRRLHRHADPLHNRRPFDETLALLE